GALPRHPRRARGGRPQRAPRRVRGAGLPRHARPPPLRRRGRAAVRRVAGADPGGAAGARPRVPQPPLERPRRPPHPRRQGRAGPRASPPRRHAPSRHRRRPLHLGQRAGYTAGGGRAGVRAVLHDEAERGGHRPRPLPRLRDRHGRPRRHPRRAKPRGGGHRLLHHAPRRATRRERRGGRRLTILGRRLTTGLAARKPSIPTPIVHPMPLPAAALPASPVVTVEDGAPLYDRELSWVAFNERVLQEAEDPGAPINERVNFLAIFSSNLAEFFRVRVAGLRALDRLKKQKRRAPDSDPAALLGERHRRVPAQQERFGAVFRDALLPALARHGLPLRDARGLTEAQADWLGRYFREHVAPLLHPVVLTEAHVGDPLDPLLENGRLYLAVELWPRGAELRSGDPTCALVEIPAPPLGRCVELPEGVAPEGQRAVLFGGHGGPRLRPVRVPGARVAEPLAPCLGTGRLSLAVGRWPRGAGPGSGGPTGALGEIRAAPLGRFVELPEGVAPEGERAVLFL